MNCFKCSTALTLKAGQKISRQEECDQCTQSMHVCKMCEFYDSNAYNECKEPVADRIVDKEKANFCDYFKLGDSTTEANHKDELLDAAAALFKN